VPEGFPEAKSIIVLAFFNRLMLVDFHLDGEKHEVMLPPQYYASGLTEERLEDIIREEIIREPGYRIERTTGVHLKLLAVRSGLGKYGRNNISYVDGMGSLLKLFAYFTDYPFEDGWTGLSMMDECEECRICRTLCPTRCIPDENFVIDVDRCVTLYNEIKGEFPGWIPPDAHNSLMGCMSCQMRCPANSEVIELTGRLEDVTEEETAKILDGTPDEELLASLSRKLRNYPPTQSKEYFPIFTRNLRALLSPENKSARSEES
jgi:epoxyqueuosine reductase